VTKLKKLSIAHIINPVIVPKNSDLYIAQPITFETMKLAKVQAEGVVDVTQFAAFYPEDEGLVPSHLLTTPPLERSVLDFDPVFNKRKLPLLVDVLDRLYEASDADYFVYTNVDIALMPHFYFVLEHFIQDGYDAFIINRRTIEPAEEALSHPPLLFAEAGTKHPGSDCFVFKRSLYPMFNFGKVCLGTNFVGLTFRLNLMAYAPQFEHMEDLHLTFHIGNDKVWDEFPQDALHNMREAEQFFSDVLANIQNLNRPDEINKLYQSFMLRKAILLIKVNGVMAYPLASILYFVSRVIKKMLRKMDRRNKQGIIPWPTALDFFQKQTIRAIKNKQII